MTRFSGTMRWFAVTILAFVWALGSGCGWIADKDRIKVAKIGDQYITRGDLFRVLREMSDEERPDVRTRSDLNRVLREHIDESIRNPLGEQLQREKKINVTREQAKQQFFAMHPEENFQLLFTTDNPEAFGMSRAEWEGALAEAELEIDRVEIELRGQSAVAYRAAEAVKNKTLVVSDEELQQEYDVRKAELNKPEQIHFLAIRFKTSEPDAESQAAEVRKRLDAGENFDTLVREYLAKSKDYILDSDIRNDPNMPKFANFWLTASGGKPGDILGPVFMPAYDLMGRPAEGKTRVIPMPDAYLVFKILEREAPRTLTFDEAKPYLVPGILIAKMTQMLRDENGVEIYYEKLPDPSIFSQSEGDPIRGE
jgi:hypothetical protein